MGRSAGGAAVGVAEVVEVSGDAEAANMQFSVSLPAVLNAGGSKGLIVFGLQQVECQPVFRKAS